MFLFSSSSSAVTFCEPEECSSSNSSGDIDNSINRESGRTPCPASSFLVNCSSSLSAITVNSISSLVSGEYLLCVHLDFRGSCPRINRSDVLS